MLLISNLFLLLVNAVTLRREFSILFNRVAIFILLYSGIIGYDSLSVTYLDTGIGISNGLFHSTAITHSFDLFIYIIAPAPAGEGTIIYFFTAFYARGIVQPIFPYNRFEPENGLFSKGYVKAYRNAGNNSQQRRYCTNKAHKLLNPHYVTGFVDASEKKALVVFGTNLTSTVCNGRLTKQVSEMIKLPSYQRGVVIGLLLSDGWLIFSNYRSKNARLGFKQALSNSAYV